MKGQRYRFFSGGVPIAGETSCELHISVETEEGVNKDTADNNAYPEVVGYSFDGTVECQVNHFRGDGLNSFGVDNFTVGQKKSFELSRTSVDDNTEEGSIIVSGDFIPTSISYKADNKKTVTASIKLEGTGVLTL